ncbi:hypothetical protein OSTOST_09184 [Ostertagia ostertagi]
MADADACQYGVTCPVEEGKEYLYEKGIEIIHNYPKVQRLVGLGSADEQETDLMIGVQ